MGTIILYTLLRLVRNKSNLFWILLFPILLACMFKVAFSNLENSNDFAVIPVAVVTDESENASQFCAVLDAADETFAPVYCEKEKALQLLEKQSVTGIFYAGDTFTLSVNADASGQTLSQNILSAFLTQYQVNATLLKETLAAHPENFNAVLAQMEEPSTPHQELTLSSRQTDSYDQYFYNQMAMACLYTAMSGILIAIGNSANLSSLAARKGIAPTKKSMLIAGELTANILFECTLGILAFLFNVFVLKINMAAHLPLAFLTIFVSILCSISLGMLIGSVGLKSEGAKIGAMFAIDMTCCFFSGLMVGDMRMVVETHAPLLNRINPAALIADSFYVLNNFDDLTRFTQNILTLLLMAVLFAVLSAFAARRKTYANL